MRVNPVLKQKDMVVGYKIAKHTVSDILRQQKSWLTFETETASVKQMQH